MLFGDFTSSLGSCFIVGFGMFALLIWGITSLAKEAAQKLEENLPEGGELSDALAQGFWQGVWDELFGRK